MISLSPWPMVNKTFIEIVCVCACMFVCWKTIRVIYGYIVKAAFPILNGKLSNWEINRFVFKLYYKKYRLLNKNLKILTSYPALPVQLFSFRMIRNLINSLLKALTAHDMLLTMTQSWLLWNDKWITWMLDQDGVHSVTNHETFINLYIK